MYNKIIFYKSSIQNKNVLQLKTKYQSQLLHKKGNDFFLNIFKIMFQNYLFNLIQILVKGLWLKSCII